jgi:hypothetical protein
MRSIWTGLAVALLSVGGPLHAVIPVSTAKQTVTDALLVPAIEPAAPAAGHLWFDGRLKYNDGADTWQLATVEEVDSWFADPSTANAFDYEVWQAELSLVPGTDVQAYSAALAAYAALSTAANKGIYFSAADTPVTYDLTSFGRTLGGLADYAALRTGAGLVIGTDDGAAAVSAIAAGVGRRSERGFLVPAEAAEGAALLFV